MRFLQRIFTAILLIATVQVAQAQYCGYAAYGGTGSGAGICTVGASLSSPGFSPPADSIPCAIQGVYFDTVVQVKVPTTVLYGGTTYTLDKIKIDTISNLPCGLCWATETSNNTFNGGSQFCLRVRGTTYDNPGQYNLRIIVDATVLTFITETVNASTAGLNFQVRVQSPSGTCVPIDTNSAGLVSSAYGPTPSDSITASGPLTFCQGGSVTFTATQTGALYQWRNGGVNISGATARTYTATAAGSYSCDITGNCQLVASPTSTVVVNTPPIASVSPAGPVILCGGSQQLLTATVSGGTQQWFNGTSSISGSTGTTYTATATGNYYVVATQSGCTDTSNKVNVQISGTPPTPTITATAPNLCAGATDTLDAGGGYTSYAWSNGLGASETANPTAAGTYYVTVTNGVCTGMDSIVIGAAAATPTPTITPSGSQSICQGSSLTLTSSAASSYLWSPGGQTTPSISVSAAGNVSVTTNNGCGAATSAPVVVSVIASPTNAVTPAGPIVLCGSGTQSLSASTGSGYAYQWLDNNAVISGANSSTYTATATGLYSCQVTANGCTDTSNVVNVQISATVLSPTITPTDTFICAGGTDTLDAGAGYTSYAWSNSLGAAEQAYPTSSGTYTVTVTNGACTGTATINISSRAATATPAITPAGSTTFCQGGSVILYSSDAVSNVWSNGGGFADSTIVTSSGSYTVTTNDGCGPATSAATVVTVNSIPPANITPSGSLLLCGGSTQVLTVSPTSGASYTWYENGSAAGGQAANTDSATTTGTYVVVVSANGCNDTASKSVQFSGTPPTPIITGSEQIICPGTSDTLNVGAGYTSYLWSGPGGSTSAIIVTSGGTYHVTVANGVCVGSDSIVVNQGSATPTPTISVTGSLHICGTDSVTLTSSSATGNLWSNAATTQSITEYNNGIFTVTTSGACGSATSAPDTVTRVAAASVGLGPDTGACTGTPVILTASTTATSILWSTGDITATDTVTVSGTYWATVSQNGCTASDTVTVEFSTAPAVTFTNNGGVLTATVVAGAIYEWYNNGALIAGADSNVLNANLYGTSNYAVKVVVGYCLGPLSAYVLVPLGIQGVSQSISTNIYPNPGNKEITIDYNLNRDEDLDISITDLTGRTVSHLFNGNQASGSYSIMADISALTGGVYLVNFKTAEGTLVRKVVKE